MNIESYLHDMRQDALDYNSFEKGFTSCTDAEIKKHEKRFELIFGIAMPDVYKRSLKFTNGMFFNGLKLFPLFPTPFFEEDIFEYNEDVNGPEPDRVIFFTIDDELYIYDNESNKFAASEHYGGIWKEFDSAEEMFEFGFKRVFEDPDSLDNLEE